MYLELHGVQFKRLKKKRSGGKVLSQRILQNWMKQLMNSNPNATLIDDLKIGSWSGECQERRRIRSPLLMISNF